MKKPVIGMIPDYDPDLNLCFLHPEHLRAIADAGGIGLVLPFSPSMQDADELTNLYDGFLFTGDPCTLCDRSSSVPLSCTRQSPADHFSLCEKLLKKALEKNKPVLAISGGMEFINTALGGTLYDDLLAFHPIAGDHFQNKPFDCCFHSNSIQANTPLEDLLKVEKLSVNSMHFQGIETLAKPLLPMAFSEDGVIEAIYAPQYDFVWGVQWHPEFLYENDPLQKQIFRHFIKSAQSGERTLH